MKIYSQADEEEVREKGGFENFSWGVESAILNFFGFQKFYFELFVIFYFDFFLSF